MDRVSGWYKRRTQTILFLVGLGLAVGMNANTVAIAIFLYENDDARDAIVAQADAFQTSVGAREGIDSIQLRQLNEEVAALDATAIPLGFRMAGNRDGGLARSALLVRRAQ
jgi:hypothetical protein